MITLLSGLFAILFYSLGTLFQGLTLAQEKSHQRKVAFFGFAALLIHLVNVYSTIITNEGYDFGFFKITTLFCWVIVALVMLSSLKRPLENLYILLFPVAILGIASATLSSDSQTMHGEYSTGMAIHILLAILATSVITIGAFQAVFLAFQNHQIKRRHSIKLIHHLPPIQTMEALLFEIILVGIVLLSGVIITGILFMDDLFEQSLSHKLALSIVAWGVFSVLLWGRHQLGWRGKTAIRWTLTGFTFLVLAYFGSKVVIELILHQT